MRPDRLLSECCAWHFHTRIFPIVLMNALPTRSSSKPMPRPGFGSLCIQGLQSLDQLSDKSFCSLDDDEALRVLRRVEGTEFFGFVRRTAALSLYDDEEVWEILGYQGPSFDQGGYVNRGFNDLDWLPEPRILYPEGEELPELGPGAHRGTADRQCGRHIDESAQR